MSQLLGSAANPLRDLQSTDQMVVLLGHTNIQPGSHGGHANRTHPQGLSKTPS